MSNNKKKKKTGKSTGKYSLLLFGILIGVFAGGSTVWWFSDKNIILPFSTEIKTFFNKRFTFKKFDEQESLSNIKHSHNTDKQKHNKGKTKEPSISIQDSLLFNNPAYSEYYDQFGSVPDSILNDTSYYKNKQSTNNGREPNTSNDIIVQKDQLLFRKQVIIKEIDTEGKAKQAFLDSVLLEAKNVNKTQPESIIVEFWKSPVNFKGYKMSKNKIVIYGLSYDENLTIEKISNLFYLKNFDTYYVLEYNDGFTPLATTKLPK